MADWDRTSAEYLERALDYVFGFGIYPSLTIVGLAVDRPPETFEELETIVEETRDPNCTASSEVDDFLEMIGGAPDPNEIVRRLPCHDGALAFVLPIFEEEE